MLWLLLLHLEICSADRNGRLLFTWTIAESQEQKEVLSKIFSGQSGGFFAAVSTMIGEMVAVKSAPITFGMEGKRRWLHIPEYLKLEIEALKGTDRIKTA